MKPSGKSALRTFMVADRKRAVALDVVEPTDCIVEERLGRDALFWPEASSPSVGIGKEAMVLAEVVCM